MVANPSASLIFAVSREKYNSAKLGNGVNDVQFKTQVRCRECGSIVYVVVVEDSTAQPLVEGIITGTHQCKQFAKTEFMNGIKTWHKLLGEKTVLFKSTRYLDGRIIAQPQLGSISDYVALVYSGDDSEVMYLGAIETRKLYVPERLVETGYGPVYIAEQCEML